MNQKDLTNENLSVIVGDHCYYLPFHQKVYGTNDPQKVALLYATFLKYLPVDKIISNYDGCSFYNGKFHVILHTYDPKTQKKHLYLP